MRDRKDSSSGSRQQGGWNQDSGRQQSQETYRDERKHGDGSRKQTQTNRTHRSQQR